MFLQSSSRLRRYRIMKILLIGVFVLAVRAAERNQTCTTPYNEKAKCISVYACPKLLEDIRSEDPDRLDFIKQSQCGYDKEPLVCCGTKDYIDTILEDIFGTSTVKPLQNRDNTNVDNSAFGKNCTTAYNEKAKCISVYACPKLLDDIRSEDPNRLDFIKQSQCGYDKEPLVCCGTKDYIDTRLEEIFGTSTVKPLQIRDNTDYSLLDRTICGVEKETTRIYGGEVTYLDEFPWMAALEYKSKLDGETVGIRCGGTLITKRHVLTAAHCISDANLMLTRVWLGEWKISTDPDCQELQGTTECADKVVKVGIERATVHPSYSRQTLKNDIGLLRLESEVQYTAYILPICLPTPDQAAPPFNTMMTVAGWGVTENGPQSDVKLKVMVPLVANNRCEFSHLVTNINQLCAGGEAGKDSCGGDSGGPLMSIRQDSGLQSQWLQEGIVSYGRGCGSPRPAIYTRVSRYINWIKDVLRETVL